MKVEENKNMNTYIFKNIKSINNSSLMIVTDDFFKSLKMAKDIDIHLTHDEIIKCDDYANCGSLDEGIYFLSKMIG